MPLWTQHSFTSLCRLLSLSRTVTTTVPPSVVFSSFKAFSPSFSQHHFSTSTLTQAGKFINSPKPPRDNTPFLKHIMATNKDRPTKAERRKRRENLYYNHMNQQQAGAASAATTPNSGVVDKYSTWTREALLQRIRELEGSAASVTATPIPAHLMDPETSSSPGSAQEESQTNTEQGPSRPDSPANDTPRRKDRRPFDFSKYAKRHVAFKIAYFGWPYGGFASQGVVDLKTIESELFNALLAARIIDDPLNCNYSRCGRTDRGVSGLGQVIALDVRSALPKSSAHVIRSEGDGFVPENVEGVSTDGSQAPLTTEELEAKAGVYYKRGIKRNKDGSVFGELAYLNIINRLLPPDIRVVAWAPVAEDFNARFHCSWRQYKYFFPKGIIDIDRMRAGAVKFLGTHDFRNFCKYDASKTIESYDRTIHEISIEPVPEHDFPGNPSREFYQLTLKGSAFLWHQVRCMMSVLFSVGQGLEEPEIVDQMMDIKQCPAKPNYDMASDLPLVLYDCHFENLEWQYQTEVDLVNDITPLRLYRSMEDAWSCYVIKSLMYSRMLQNLDKAMLYNLPEKGNQILLGDYAKQNAPKESNISLGGDLRMFMGKKYSQLMYRQKCLPTEVKFKKHQERKRQKLALAESAAGSENASADNSEMDSPSLTSTPTMVDESIKTAASLLSTETLASESSGVVAEDKPSATSDQA